MPANKPQAGEMYQHFKGMKYKIIGICKHSETLEGLVCYECLYENELSKIWVRPLEEFMGTLVRDGEVKKRFTKINS